MTRRVQPIKVTVQGEPDLDALDFLAEYLADRLEEEDGQGRSVLELVHDADAVNKGRKLP